MFMRPNDTELYPVVTTLVDGILTWIPSEADTCQSGDGCAVVFMKGPNNSFLGKSKVYPAQISDSPSAGGTSPPSPFQPYVMQVLEAKQYIQSKFESIDEIVEGIEDTVDEAQSAIEQKTAAAIQVIDDQATLKKSEFPRITIDSNGDISVEV